MVLKSGINALNRISLIDMQQSNFFNKYAEQPRDSITYKKNLNHYIKRQSFK